jgi:outer membrane protein assembly factor BamD
MIVIVAKFVKKSIKKTLCMLVMLCIIVASFAETKQTSVTSPLIKLNKQASYAFNHEDYSYAINLYEQLLNQYPFVPIARSARIQLTYAYYTQADYTQAHSMADTFLHLYPRDPHADYMLYIKGLSQFQHKQSWLQRKFLINEANYAQDNLPDAFKDLKQLTLLYPNSPYTPNALTYMKKIRNILAKKDFLVARYYFKSQNYIASSNRCIHALRNYPGSPYLSMIKSLLQKNYHKLGLKEQEKLVTQTKSHAC